MRYWTQIELCEMAPTIELAQSKSLVLIPASTPLICKTFNLESAQILSS